VHQFDTEAGQNYACPHSNVLRIPRLANNAHNIMKYVIKASVLDNDPRASIETQAMIRLWGPNTFPPIIVLCSRCV
jgi:hypothetical protein